jgi:hypothetical protein
MGTAQVRVVVTRQPEAQGLAMEFMTVTGIQDNRRYIAIYRKWFNEKLGAWELEIVPGTLRWII